MQYNFSTDKPIYIQLLDEFKTAIASGELAAGTKLESVRDLASKAQVNPNTMQKALTELERLNLVFTERTSGRYITKDEALIKEMKNSFVKEEISKLCTKLENFGYTKEEIINMIKE